MPPGVGSVIVFLCVGYFLVLAELIVPGGILGIAGILFIGYGCWLAFGLSIGWGLVSVTLSVLVFAICAWVLWRNRNRPGIVLLGNEAKTWKAPNENLRQLLGAEGRTLTPLRPSGTMMIGDERVDVVADAEFLPADVPVRVLEVEGSRVVVEPVTDVADSKAHGADEPDSDLSDSEASDSDVSDSEAQDSEAHDSEAHDSEAHDSEAHDSDPAFT